MNKQGLSSKGATPCQDESELYIKLGHWCLNRRPSLPSSPLPNEDTGEFVKASKAIHLLIFHCKLSWPISIKRTTTDLSRDPFVSAISKFFHRHS
jgi:hypothetical protein